MTIQTIESAAVYRADGQQQIFYLRASDGEPIPYGDPTEIAVFIDGVPLTEGSDFTLNENADDDTFVTLFSAPERGTEVSVERNTQLIQPKAFRLAGDWNIDSVEENFDRVVMAVQDALRRLSKVEKIVQIEHRQVEVPLGAPDPELVLAVTKELQTMGLSDADKAHLAEVIATVTVEEFHKMHQALAQRVADLEYKIHGVAEATREPIA